MLFRLALGLTGISVCLDPTLDRREADSAATQAQWWQRCGRSLEDERRSIGLASLHWFYLGTRRLAVALRISLLLGLIRSV